MGGGRYDDRLTRGRLRQAYGRLVRRADDRGVFVLLDPALPSRLGGAFPQGVTVERVGLAEAVRITRAFVGPADETHAALDCPRARRYASVRRAAHEWATGADGSRAVGERNQVTFAYSSGEKIADTVVHAVSIAASIAGLTMLVIVGSRYAGALPVTTYAIYGGSMLLMITVSGLYHWITHARFKAVLRVMDHCAIYVLIAGTYTPVTLLGLRGAWSWALFGVVWGIAIAGVLVKTLAVGRLERLSIGLYLLLGWVGLIGLGPLIEHLAWPALALIGSGGLLFSVGALVFYRWHSLPYHNFAWHLFVMAGAMTHYFAVIFYVRPAT